MTCKYYDCGFCYAPADAKNNSIQGGCFEPEYCATYLMQNKMTDFQPKPQTPEQVADGLRNAFRQAMKDGVMDATPYLKQMTFKSDIEKTEAEIKVLQKKLELLKEIETHKSQPSTLYDMLTEFSSSVNKNYICEIVSEWLPDEDDGDDRYACGWNDCLEKLKLRLK